MMQLKIILLLNFFRMVKLSHNLVQNTLIAKLLYLGEHTYLINILELKTLNYVIPYNLNLKFNIKIKKLGVKFMRLLDKLEGINSWSMLTLLLICKLWNINLIIFSKKFPKQIALILKLKKYHIYYLRICA